MFHAAAQHRDITNALGTHIQGATVGGLATSVRDRLEANALYLSDTHAAVLFISCDLGGLEPGVTDRVCNRIASATTLDRAQIILGATHTGGPSVIPTNYLKPIDADYLDELCERLVSLASDTVAAAVPAELAVALGTAPIGHQRRCCWADGHHTMHRGRNQGNFTGLEGPSDAEQFVLFVRGTGGELIGVLHQNTAHPCTFYGADFYSADYPGEARRLLRQAIRDDLSVLFFNGAFGDQGQERQDDLRTLETARQKLTRCGAIVAGETLRLLHEADFSSDLPFEVACRELESVVRLPDPTRLADARMTLARVDAGEEIPAFDIAFAHGAVLLQKRFGECPVEGLPIHVVRIGPAAIVTQPTELFCEFGLTIKMRSPFPITAVFSICDGYRGYCPTYHAAISGGYSAEPIYWTRFTAATGYDIVDAACAALHGLAGPDSWAKRATRSAAK